MENKSYSLNELAAHTGAAVVGDGETRVWGISSLEDAVKGQLSFVAHGRHLAAARKSKASCLLVSSHISKDLQGPQLVCDQVYLAVARLSRFFKEPPRLAPGIHPSALVDESAQLQEGVRLGALAQVGPHSRIGKNSRIYGGTYVGEHVHVGEDCLIYPNVTLMDHCFIGDRVIIYSGAVIGADGFGFAQDDAGRHIRIEQFGTVHIDDDAEIGANTTVDRAAFGRTWVQRGAKIDNLVMVAHNVTVGEDSILVGQVGISGSTTIGRHVVMAGQVGVAGHLTIGDRVRIGARSGVAHSIKPGLDVLGLPAQPQKEWFETMKHIRRLPRLRDEFKELKARIEELEKSLDREQR